MIMIKKIKAQISIFIVISIIIIIGTIFLIGSNEGGFDNINIFSDQKSSYKIEQFVESCLMSQTKIAQKKIGQKGGWLYYNQANKFTNRNFPSSINEKADGLDILERNKMTYWYYFDDVSKEFVINVPEFATENPLSIRNQIRRYLVENIDKECINGFQSFKEQYDIKYDRDEFLEGIKVDFDGKKIISSLKSSIEITDIAKEDSEFIEQFEITTDNKIYNQYYLGLDIIASESQNSFMEESIINILSPYQSSSRRDLLPPYQYTHIGADYAPWNVKKVEKLAKNFISSNIGQVQFLNTDYLEMEVPEQYKETDFAKGMQNLFLKDYLSEYSLIKEDDSSLFEDFKNYKVTPVYNSFFPSTFEITNSQGGLILQPKVTSMLGIPILPIYMTEYVAKYRMITPIMFEIRGNDKYNNYDFDFVIETNIVNNAPLLDINYKKDALTKLDSIEVGDSLICSPFQRISKPVKFNITDPINFGKGGVNGVDGASIKFDCKGLSVCNVGITSINKISSNGSSSEVSLQLPINCEPGTLEISKPGFSTLKINNVNPNSFDEIDLGNLEMPSQKTMKVLLNLLPETGSGREINDNEKAVVIIEDVNDENNVKTIDVDKFNKNFVTVDLGVGEYKFSGFVMMEEDFTIKGKTIEADDEEIVIDDINMTSWMSGGVELESVKIKKSDLINNEYVKIFMVDYGIPKTFDEFSASSGIMGKVKDYSQKPKFFKSKQ